MAVAAGVPAVVEAPGTAAGGAGEVAVEEDHLVVRVVHPEAAALKADQAVPAHRGRQAGAAREDQADRVARDTKR